MSQIWYSSSTFNRAFIWYPWCRNRTIFEKKILSPIYIEVFHTYDASDEKHGFLKFWTLNFENGVWWSSGTTLDVSPKKIPAFFLHSYHISKFMKFSRSKYIFSLEIFILFKAIREQKSGVFLKSMEPNVFCQCSNVELHFEWPI